jgi:RNA polymerase sigma-70 factor (ECF subfamily)
MLKPECQRDLPEPTGLPDEHLVRMAQRDPTTFMHLYDRYVDQIYRYCRRRLPAAQAEDVTSITFLNALRALQTMDPARSGFRPWLYRIAHNALIDQTRERKHVDLDDVAIEDGGEHLDDVVIALDDRNRLDDAIQHLPPDQFAVISLRLSGLSGPEIAEVTGKSHEAVRGLQFRAIQRLRKTLVPDADQMPAGEMS